jgi:hypothetical protein
MYGSLNHHDILIPWIYNQEIGRGSKYNG